MLTLGFSKTPLNPLLVRALYRQIRASSLGNVNEHVACSQILAVGIKRVDFTLKKCWRNMDACSTRSQHQTMLNMAHAGVPSSAG